MYNLIVSGNGDTWQGEPYLLDADRCVTEYTDVEITRKFAALDAASIAELLRLPCIFACEAYNKKHPKFGIIHNITKRQLEVRIEYGIVPVSPFLTFDQFDSLRFELDIAKWEMNRTHWAVKDVNLAKELKDLGIILPDWARGSSAKVDITTHVFDVALSFPGECCSFVESVAVELERNVGPNSYFYDDNYIS